MATALLVASSVSTFLGHDYGLQNQKRLLILCFSFKEIGLILLMLIAQLLLQRETTARHRYVPLRTLES